MCVDHNYFILPLKKTVSNSDVSLTVIVCFETAFKFLK